MIALQHRWSNGRSVTIWRWQCHYVWMTQEITLSRGMDVMIWAEFNFFMFRYVCVCAVYMYIVIMSPWILYVHVWDVLLCTCMYIYSCIYHIHILHPANMNIYCYTYGNKHPKIKLFERKKAPIPLFHAFFSAFHRVVLSLESTSNLQLVGSALEDALPQPSRENAYSGYPNKMGQIWFLSAQHVTIEMAVSTMVGVVAHFLQVRL